MLAIAWQYLTGRAIATDFADRTRAEWPPHPDRVFQSLVAAWGESGQDAEEAAALRWLEGLGEPEIACPLQVGRVDPVRVFVPVNDIEGAARGEYAPDHRKLLPAQRPRQPRWFPSVQVGGATVALRWPDAPTGPREALSRLCAKVTRIGHSASLVRMWLCDAPPAATLRPCDSAAEHRLRVPAAGRLDALVSAFAAGGDDWRRPPPARWTGYAPVDRTRAAPRGDFDARLLVLRRTGGIRAELRHAPALVSALRAVLISAADASPAAKRLISGHEPDGAPLRDPHVAILPLAFVGDPAQPGGSRFADGRVLGLAIALPVAITADDEQAVLASIAGAFRGHPDRTRQLVLGRAGALSVTSEPLDAPPVTLRPPTWCRSARVWASVTPVALDRSPPRRHGDADAWTREQILAACKAQGIPTPRQIDLLPVSPCLGGPAASEMPALLRKDGTRRWHVHARLLFDAPCAGPMVIGAGRYRGYGLFRPMSEAT